MNTLDKHNIIAVLQNHAKQQPSKQAYIFLADGQTEKDKITYL